MTESMVPVSSAELDCLNNFCKVQRAHGEAMVHITVTQLERLMHDNNVLRRLAAIHWKSWKLSERRLGLNRKEAAAERDRLKRDFLAEYNISEEQAKAWMLFKE